MIHAMIPATRGCTGPGATPGTSTPERPGDRAGRGGLRAGSALGRLITGDGSLSPRAHPRSGSLASPASGLLAGSLAALLVVLPGCRRQEKVPPPDLVATIAGEPVRYESFAAHVAASVGEEGSTLAPEVLSSLFDQYLDELLLERLAVERGLVTQGRGGRLAAEALLVASDAARVSDAEVASFYETHREQFQRPERVRLRQLLFTDRRVAEKAHRELVRGADFATVAASAGSDGNGAIGAGGELAREDLPLAFVDLIFSLRPGEISEVVQADYGFHLFLVESHSRAEQIPLDLAAAEIRTTLERQRGDQALADLVATARARFPVTVVTGNLPFAYQGAYVATFS